MSDRKTCTKCGVAKPHTEYQRNGKRKDGTTAYRPDCKECCRAYKVANADRFREYQRAYRAIPANRARDAENMRRWQKANASKCAANTARRRAFKRRVETKPYDRDELFARWGHTCCYCDAPAEHVEHITPISKGGPDALSNVTVACQNCNLSKGAKSLAEWALTWVFDPLESLALKAQHHSEEENGNHDLQNA